MERRILRKKARSPVTADFESDIAATASNPCEPRSSVGEMAAVDAGPEGLKHPDTHPDRLGTLADGSPSDDKSRSNSCDRPVERNENESADPVGDGSAKVEVADSVPRKRTRKSAGS